MYNAYMDGTLDYVTWTQRLVTLYKERGRASKDVVTDTLTHYTLKGGTEDLVTHLHEKGYETALITGSFDILAKDIADRLSIKHWKANSSFVFNNSGAFIDLETCGDETKNKPKHLTEICTDIGITPEECVCVGDGINDVELFKLTGKGITFNEAPEKLKRVAWKVVSNLSEIRDIL